MTRLRTIPALVVFALSIGLAQPDLFVDGVQVIGNTSDLIEGRSYAPARALALALGAELVIDVARTSATLTLGGRLLQVAVAPDAASAAGVSEALSLDGAALASPAAVDVNGDIFLPVQPIILAFGGSAAFVDDRNAVVAVLPTAHLVDTTSTRLGARERLIFRLSAPASVQPFFNEPLQTLQIRIGRGSVARAASYEGSLYVRADVIPGDRLLDIRIVLGPGTGYRLLQLPAADGGFDLVIEMDRGADDAPTERVRAVVVIDPGHGGTDAGLEFPALGSEAALALDFGNRLATALERIGMSVLVTRNGDLAVPPDSRSAAGVGSDLFISVHAGGLQQGRFNVYFLDDAADEAGLSLAIRENARAALADNPTDSVRRQVLLGLVPDLEVGRRYARSLELQLSQAGGYLVEERLGVPLFVLSGSGGRGLMLEFSPEDLAGAALAPLLASVLASLLGSGGFD